MGRYITAKFTVNIVPCDSFNNAAGKTALKEVEMAVMPKDTVTYDKRRRSSGLVAAKIPYYEETAPLAKCYVQKHTDVAMQMMETMATEKVDANSFYHCGTINENMDFELEDEGSDGAMDGNFFFGLKNRIA
jgi:hypothetical protein